MIDIHDIVWVNNPESNSNLKLARVEKIGFRGKIKLVGDKVWITSGFRLATDTEERSFISSEKIPFIERIRLWIKRRTSF